MKIEIDSKKYKIKKTQDDGVIRIVAIPKKRNCKYCTKQFESMNQGKLYWKDSNGYQRSDWFCKEHYKTIRDLLIENR